MKIVGLIAIMVATLHTGCFDGDAEALPNGPHWEEGVKRGKGIQQYEDMTGGEKMIWTVVTNFPISQTGLYQVLLKTHIRGGEIKVLAVCPTESKPNTVGKLSWARGMHTPQSLQEFRVPVFTPSETK